MSPLKSLKELLTMPDPYPSKGLVATVPEIDAAIRFDWTDTAPTAWVGRPLDYGLARTAMHSDCFQGSRADAIAFFGWCPSRSDAKRKRLKKHAKARRRAR